MAQSTKHKRGSTAGKARKAKPAAKTGAKSTSKSSAKSTARSSAKSIHSKTPLDPIQLTRELVDIESITGNEAHVGRFLAKRLERLGYDVELMRVVGDRANVIALPPKNPKPLVVLSTHIDTVPPFYPSREDAETIYGRGACDAKGIAAAEIAAAERLRAEGYDVGLLFLVGEERDNIGARFANNHAFGSRFLVNGEPTENRLALATKGALDVELTATGKMAHSGYPEFGESAIEKLIEALHNLLRLNLPSTAEAGSTTLNVGLIQGGRAANVVPDHAQASLLFRTIGATAELRRQVLEAVGNLARVDFLSEMPYLKLDRIGTLPTMVASFFTDIPSLTNWGKPVLIGPGSIRHAHTENEQIKKSELLKAVGIYADIAKELLAQSKQAR